MLLSGINHVAVLTGDTDRLVAFYDEVFDATSTSLQGADAFRVTAIWLGASAELNVFEIDGNIEHERQVPMFGRGRLDHMALEAASLESFDAIRERLLARDATDGFVTDFGHMLSLFFRDPDGLECEVCVANPDARLGVHNPPGTPSSRYHPAGTPPPARMADRPLPRAVTRVADIRVCPGEAPGRWRPWRTLSGPRVSVEPVPVPGRPSSRRSSSASCCS